jgi:hypothetical protein
MYPSLGFPILDGHQILVFEVRVFPHLLFGCQQFLSEYYIYWVTKVLLFRPLLPSFSKHSHLAGCGRPWATSGPFLRFSNVNQDGLHLHLVQ